MTSARRPTSPAGRRALTLAALGGALVGALAVLVAFSLGGSLAAGRAFLPGGEGTPTASGSPTPPPIVFPTRETTGVPAGWTPVETVSGDVVVRTPGEVVEDLRILDGHLIVAAPDVTVRRVEILGGSIANLSDQVCQNGLLIEDTTIGRGTGGTTATDWPAIAAGGYTALRVLIDGLPEGFRVGGVGSCGPVVIEDSYAAIRYPDECNDWHGDALQGFHGPKLTIRTSAFELIEGDCPGTAAFFYPSGQGNTEVDIDGLLVRGGGYPFRLGTPGTVRGLRIVDGAWGFGPMDVKCSVMTDWEAQIVALGPDDQLTSARNLPCRTEGGN